MQDSIFTKIIKGEIPCHKVYEDDKTLAFMDIHPFNEGQVLVVPKEQVEFVWDLQDEDYRALWSTVKKIAYRLREVFPDKIRVGVHVEGLDVNHAHVKIFPFSTGAEFHARADDDAEPDHEELAKLAEKLYFQ